jgi:hypothetical protein
VGAACIGAGLTLVWLEIGKPWRALHVFFHPQTSWMTREGILAGPLLGSCALAWWFNQPAWLALATPLAAGFLYSQARILRAARAIPAWSNPKGVPLVIATGLAEGLGAFVALAALAGGPTGAAPLLVVLAALTAGIAREVLRAVYRRALEAARAPQPTMAWFAPPRSARAAGHAHRLGAVAGRGAHRRPLGAGAGRPARRGRRLGLQGGADHPRGLHPRRRYPDHAHPRAQPGAQRGVVRRSGAAPAGPAAPTPFAAPPDHGGAARAAQSLA